MRRCAAAGVMPNKVLIKIDAICFCQNVTSEAVRMEALLTFFFNNLNFPSIQVLSRYRETKLQVGENYL